MDEKRKFTSEMVDDYSEKLLIGLTPEENKMVLDEFENIDKNFQSVRKNRRVERSRADVMVSR